MKRKILSCLVLLCMVVTLLPTNMIMVSAYNETKYDDYLYYRVESNGEVTITDCDSSATEVEIPSEIDGMPVVAIGSLAFYKCGGNLTCITIPDSVTSIGRSAFWACSGLTSIIFGNSVISVGDYAFEGCTSLASITIPDSVESIGGLAFSGCTSLTSITIGNSVTSIGYRAFGDCSSLISITIPDSVTAIGEGAFKGCRSLTSITIPDSVTSIGENAFVGCTNLTNVYADSLKSYLNCNYGFSGFYPENNICYLLKSSPFY